VDRAEASAPSSPGARPGPARGRSPGRRPWGRAPRCCSWWSRCRRRSSASSVSATSGCRTRGGGAGRATFAKSTAVSTVTAAVAALLLMALIRRFPRSWFVGGAVAMVLLSLGVRVRLAGGDRIRCSNKFTRAAGGAAARVPCFDLARRSGVDVGRSTGSTPGVQTTGANAYVSGDRGEQARGALRHADRQLLARPGRLRGGPRARPREAPRRAARPPVGRDRRASRDVPHPGAHGEDRRAAEAGRARAAAPRRHSP